MTAPLPFPPSRATPRISVAQLGVYMVARAGRRETIIKQQRRPKTFRTNRYEDASRALQRALAAGTDGLRVLAAERARLAAQVGGTEHEIQNRTLCIAALDAIAAAWDSLDFGGFLPALGHPSPPKLRIQEVGISVRPELTLHGRDDQGHPLIGAIKLRFSKTEPLPSDAAKYIAAAVEWHLEHVAGVGVNVSPVHCVVLDVFTGAITRAPRAKARRRADIAAACREIALGWDGL